MDEYQHMSTRERAMGMPDTALIDGVVSAQRASRNAMSQSAFLGNAQMVLVYIEELEQRAQDRKDGSVIAALNDRLSQEFGTPQKSQE